LDTQSVSRAPEGRSPAFRAADVATSAKFTIVSHFIRRIGAKLKARFPIIAALAADPFSGHSVYQAFAPQQFL
jgi:hypothetical protein